MFERLFIWMVIAMSLLMTAIILIVYTNHRESEFYAYQKAIQQSMVNGAAHSITMALKKKHLDVHLFASEYSRLINFLILNPQSEQTAEDIKQRLANRFPDFFTFTITDQRARPQILDVESLVGELCQHDLVEFATGMEEDLDHVHNPVYIHPQFESYHYDVMVPLPSGDGKSRIFFVSFYPDFLANTLRTYETPGHQLILVKTGDLSLIEVSDTGARDQLQRDIRLTPEEMRRIRVFKDLPDTGWRLVDLPKGDYEQLHVRGLWKEAAVMLLVVLLANLFIAALLLKITSKSRSVS